MRTHAESCANKMAITKTKELIKMFAVKVAVTTIVASTMTDAMTPMTAMVTMEVCYRPESNLKAIHRTNNMKLLTNVRYNKSSTQKT